MAELTLLEKKKIAEEINKNILSIRSIPIKLKTSKSTVQRIKFLFLSICPFPAIKIIKELDILNTTISMER